VDFDGAQHNLFKFVRFEQFKVNGTSICLNVRELWVNINRREL
jgi:hypothetical protein